ncbi:MAG: Crp/Fnr family transcriptional regulator [Deltaproteobacteria bacterium]|nr:Crp/Fnr family transcriptional regulator [Deltaproteobacteria bacterium]
MKRCKACQEEARQKGRLPTIFQGHFEKLLRTGDELHFRPGQVLYYKGHMPCGIYLLQKGHVAFSHTSHVKESELVPFKKGHPLGLLHLAFELPYCHSCTAFDEVSVLFFPKSVLLSDSAPKWMEEFA